MTAQGRMLGVNSLWERIKRSVGFGSYVLKVRKRGNSVTSDKSQAVLDLERSVKTNAERFGNCINRNKN